MLHTGACPAGWRHISAPRVLRSVLEHRGYETDWPGSTASHERYARRAWEIECPLARDDVLRRTTSTRPRRLLPAAVLAQRVGLGGAHTGIATFAVHHLGLPRIRQRPLRRTGPPRGRPPSPRRRRAGHRRAEISRARPPSLRPVHRQRRLAGVTTIAHNRGMPARLVHTTRRLRLCAPERWPWAEAFTAAMTAITNLPQHT